MVLKNHYRGQNKFQYVYDSCSYKVVHEPGEQGAKHFVAPVSQAGPVKQVHQMEMRKALIDPVLSEMDSTVSDEAVSSSSGSSTDSDSDSASCVLLQLYCDVSPPTIAEDSVLESSAVIRGSTLRAEAF